MIDDRKIKRELRKLKEEALEGSMEKRIYGAFLEYINRQQCITLEQIRFEQRMTAIWTAWMMHKAAGQKRSNSV